MVPWSGFQVTRNVFFCKNYVKFNVLKSGTLLSATPERHSQNRERRRSATPFYQKERCGSGTHIFEESENMRGPLLSLFFFWNFLFFWHSFSVNKLVSPSLLWFIYSWKQRYFQLDIKFLLNFQIQVCILVRKKILIFFLTRLKD